MNPDNIAGCLDDVQRRLMMDAVYTDEPVTSYVRDWMSQGHLDDGYTAEEMTEAIRALYVSDLRFSRIVEGF
jgi:hypothetical protein